MKRNLRNSIAILVVTACLLYFGSCSDHIEHDGVSENNDTEQNFLDEKEDSGRYAFRNGGGSVGHSPHKTSSFSHH